MSSLQFPHVDRDAVGVDPDAVAVGEDTRVFLVVDEAPELGQAPAQRAARVVGDLPQQLAEMLAAETPGLQAQVGQQRAGLLGRRQG